MSRASSLLPLWNRAAEWQRRLGMIRDATSFLYLSTYYIEYDFYGIELLAALRAAQERGAAVNLLIDGFGQTLGGVLMSRQSLAVLASRFDELKSAGAVVTVYRPGRYLQRVLGGGQHVKIQVSEAGEAIFGSGNITRSSFEGWNEYSVSLRGPVVPQLLESYRRIGGSVVASRIFGACVRCRAAKRQISSSTTGCAIPTPSSPDSAPLAGADRMPCRSA